MSKSTAAIVITLIFITYSTFMVINTMIFLKRVNKKLPIKDEWQKCNNLLEIRFRGKRKKDGQWIYGFYVGTNGVHRIIYEDLEGYYMEEEVIPETVEQYIEYKRRV